MTAPAGGGRREQLAGIIDWALFGITDGGLLDPDDASVPVGEFQRLIREKAVPALERAELVVAAEPIEINQDYDYSSGEIGGLLPVFWAKGHGYDAKEFVRAVVDYCLDEDADIPAITWEDSPEEKWQRNVDIDAGVFYERDVVPPKSLREGKFAITILDLERPRRRGATKCSVDGCREPWSSGTPVRVATEVLAGDSTLDCSYMAVTVWLCRGHRKKLPEPSYRVVMVPVGATIVLPPDVSSGDEGEPAEGSGHRD